MSEEKTTIESEVKLPKRWLMNYLPMWFGQVLSILGSSVVQFAVIWYLTEKTGSASVLALASLISGAPQVIIGPFAGALVDRWNRKLVMLVSDGFVAFLTLVMAALFTSGRIQTWHILTILFLRSMVGSFQWPAMRASVSLMVPKEHLSRLGGIDQAVDGLLNIIAPVLGALLLSLWKMQQVLMVDIFTALLAMSLLAFLVKVPQPAAKKEISKLSPKSLWADVRTGMRYAWSWSGMFKLLLLAAAINLVFAPSGALMPLLVSKVFSRGAADLALMESVFGIGVIVGGVSLGIWGGFKRRIDTVLMGVTGMGLGTLPIALARQDQFYLAVLGMGLLGFLSSFANGSLGSIVQTKVSPEMQGRVFTVMGSMAGMAVPLGLIIAGPLADKIGIQPLNLLAGLSGIAIGVAGFLSKDVRTLESQEPGGGSASDADNQPDFVS